MDPPSKKDAANSNHQPHLKLPQLPQPQPTKSREVASPKPIGSHNPLPKHLFFLQLHQGLLSRWDCSCAQVKVHMQDSVLSKLPGANHPSVISWEVEWAQHVSTWAASSDFKIQVGSSSCLCTAFIFSWLEICSASAVMDKHRKVWY